MITFKNIITKFQKKRYESYLKITNYYNNLTNDELTCEYINMKASYKFKKISFTIFIPFFLFVIYKIMNFLFIYFHFFPKIEYTNELQYIKYGIISLNIITISFALIFYFFIKIILNILRYYYQNILILEMVIEKRKKLNK